MNNGSHDTLCETLIKLCIRCFQMFDAKEKVISIVLKYIARKHLMERFSQGKSTVFLITLDVLTVQESISHYTKTLNFAA